MRIVFFGSPPFGTASFEALLARTPRPVALVTAPERRGGRGRKSALANPMVAAAEAAGLPLLRPADARAPEFLGELRALEPDLGVVVSFGQILSDELLAIPRLGCINLHGSVLPRWRGASPIQATILAGDTTTGVTIQKVVRRLDAGALLATREIAIGERDTAVDLAPRLSRLGAELLVEFLDDVGEGPLPSGEEQDESQVTVCRKLRRDAARIDWSASAVDVDRRVRAMAGWPVAETASPGGEVWKILAGAPTATRRSDAQAGTVLAVGETIDIACGSGSYAIERLQRAGRGALEAADFLRGCPLKVGERFG